MNGEVHQFLKNLYVRKSQTEMKGAVMTVVMIGVVGYARICEEVVFYI